jgi:hypothetical protein
MNENQTEVIASGKSGILEKISFAILFVFSFLVPIFFVPVSFISTQFGTSLLFAISSELEVKSLVKFILSIHYPNDNFFLSFLKNVSFDTLSTGETRDFSIIFLPEADSRYESQNATSGSDLINL